MTFVSRHDPILKETVLTTRLSSGLELLVWPKRGFRRKFAGIGTRFGSIDNRYRSPSGAGEILLPDGVAHFLEHKLFEGPEGDVFDQFAQLGASANASTSFTSTRYFFCCTDRFGESYSTLLDFVQEPYFTDEAIDRERGIIGQEIQMYEDLPDEQIFLHLLEAMYHRHPVRVDIAGTLASIEKIDRAVLQEAYQTFYHPSNMTVLVAGDVDPEEIRQATEENLQAHHHPEAKPIERIQIDEPAAVGQSRVENRMPVSRPKLLIGYKDSAPKADPTERMRTEGVTGLLLDLLFGKGSPFYSSLYEKGILDDSFDASFTAEPCHAYTLIGGDTDSPDRLAEAIQDAVIQADKQGLPASALARKKRKRIGQFLRQFDAPDSGGATLLDSHLRGQDPTAYLPILEQIEPADLAERLRDHLLPQAQVATSTIQPIEDA